MIKRLLKRDLLGGGVPLLLSQGFNEGDEEIWRTETGIKVDRHSHHGRVLMILMLYQSTFKFRSAGGGNSAGFLDLSGGAEWDGDTDLCAGVV